MIESNDPVAGPYIGNSSATTFAYNIPIRASSELIVTKTVIATGVESVLINNTDYEVNGVGSSDDADWDITYPKSGSPMTSAERIVITPNIPILQETDFENNGGFLPENHTAAFDRVTVICQQLSAELDRCVKTTVGSTTSPDDLISDLEQAAADAEAAAATAAAVITGLTTKGDLLTFSTANTRLPVGTNGKILSADSGQATGLNWINPATFASLSPLTTQGDLLFFSTINDRLPKGTALQKLRMNAGATAPEWFTDSIGDIVIIEDQKTSGTQGGTATTASWQTHVLNTEVADTGNNAVIASNQITLLAGTYRVRAVSRFNGVQFAQIRLRNITDSATLAVGQSVFANFAAQTSDPSTIEGRFTIAGTKVIELQYFASASSSTADLGTATTSGEVEVYASVVLLKE